MNMTPKIDLCQRPPLILPNSYIPISPTPEIPKTEEPIQEVKPEDVPIEIKEEEKSLFDIQKENLKKHKRKDSWGFVQKADVKAMREIIKQSLGHEPFVSSGYHISVVIYESQFARSLDGKKSVIYQGDPSVKEERFRNPVGLVVDLGPDAYKGKRFQEHWGIRFLRLFFDRWMPESQKKAWCREGDWVLIARHEGPMINYRGKPVLIIPDTGIYGVVENPDYVWRD